MTDAAAILNYGVGGTTVARNTNEHRYRRETFVARCQTLPDAAWDADVAFVFGGTNDFWVGNAPFGDEDSSNPFEFNGALNIIIHTLRSMSPKMRIVLVTPTPRVEQNIPNGTTGGTLEDYADAILLAAQRHGLPCCDLFRVEAFKPDSCAEYADGLHPNDAGHKRIAEELYAFVSALDADE